jgi:hypothetical protein
MDAEKHQMKNAEKHKMKNAEKHLNTTERK